LGSEKNMKRQNQKISNPVRNEFLSGANEVKNIFKKTLKFVSSRLTYLIIGIFIAIGATYVYAAWNDAKTGDSGQLSQTNWNSLVNEIHNKCGTNCDTVATAATASSDILTENNWNNLVDLTNNTLVDCTDNNGGKCFINQTSKTALDTDLAAGNIKSGINVFGVAGNYSGPVLNDCTADNGGQCYISQATKSTLDNDLSASNIKTGTTIFGITGTSVIKCYAYLDGCTTGWCTLGTTCSQSCSGNDIYIDFSTNGANSFSLYCRSSIGDAQTCYLYCTH